jgi:hypothetical protein
MTTITSNFTAANGTKLTALSEFTGLVTLIGTADFEVQNNRLSALVGGACAINNSSVDDQTVTVTPILGGLTISFRDTISNGIYALTINANGSALLTKNFGAFPGGAQVFSGIWDPASPIDAISTEVAVVPSGLQFIIKKNSTVLATVIDTAPIPLGRLKIELDTGTVIDNLFLDFKASPLNAPASPTAGAVSNVLTSTIRLRVKI